MKFLLTSSGIANKSIENALLGLLEKPFSETRLAFISTASVIEPGDKSWVIEDLSDLKNLGFKEIDIIDFSALPVEEIKRRLAPMDVMYFSGGNPFNLKYWIEKLNLGPMLADLLNRQIWVGVSAGSMVPGEIVLSDEEKAFAEKLYGPIDDKGLGLVNLSLEPHYLSPLFDTPSDDYFKEASKKISHKIYVIDDETAVMVNGKNIEIISEGNWKEF